MSEADRVFSRHPKQPTSSNETRHIVTASRKNRSGVMANRVVEVVHVARGTPKPLKDHLHPVGRNAHAETWHDGFCAKPPSPVPSPEAKPVVPELTSPTVHVMPAWEPSVQQPALTDKESAELPSSVAAIEHRKQRKAKSNAPKVTMRRFADPFAADDTGANCMRCGYLVEQAREARGLWTCSKCG